MGMPASATWVTLASAWDPVYADFRLYILRPLGRFFSFPGLPAVELCPLLSQQQYALGRELFPEVLRAYAHIQRHIKQQRPGYPLIPGLYAFGTASCASGAGRLPSTAWASFSLTSGMSISWNLSENSCQVISGLVALSAA